MTDLFHQEDCDRTSYGRLMTSHPQSQCPSDCISLDTANRLYRERVLAKGVRAYGRIFSDGDGHYTTSGKTSLDTHTALLINVEEIEKDSAEKCLKDLMEFLNPDGLTATQVINRAGDLSKIYDRAKRLLGGE